MGQLDSTCSAPPHPNEVGESPRHREVGVAGDELDSARGVALQVAFERQTLKTVFSLDRL
jgi:hypothetical protein